MSRNILITSLSAVEMNQPVQYYSIRKEFGFDYCDALLDAEAGVKAILARYAIDEIIVIGDAGSYDDESDLTPVSIRHGSALYSGDKASFSAYKLLQYRIAQFADELTTAQDANGVRLSPEMQEKIIRFIRDYQENNPELKNKKWNRLFDLLAQNEEGYVSFLNALFKAYPELRDNSASCMEWIKSYLYEALKPSAKLELLPVNEDVRISLIPERDMEDSSQWVESIMATEKSIAGSEEDSNLYVVLNGEDAADTFIFLNMLDVLISMPGSFIQLKKIFTMRKHQRRLTGIIRDDTDGYGVTVLFHAIRAFLNYGKADMIVNFWNKSGEYNEMIAGMVYAMRHVDVGLSMCNIQEVEAGILHLRQLFRDEKFWRESGYYGLCFSIIAKSIQEDYGVLLEGDGEISFIELVKWAYRHQFYQQTLTLIESRAPEMLVKSGIFYYCSDESLKDSVTRLFAKQRLELKPYEYYKMDLIDHYFIKNYNRSGVKNVGARGEDPQRLYAAVRTQSVENRDPSLITGLTSCDSMDTLQNILFAYYHIGKVRNKISHADTNAMSESRLVVLNSDESSALIWMKESIDYFICSYEKAMAEVQGKNPQVIIITGEEVRRTADKMKRERHKEVIT